MNTINKIDSVLGNIDNILRENEVSKRLVDEYNKSISELEAELDNLNKEVELIRKCIYVFQVISDERSDKSREDISELINSALMSIFPEREYRIIIDEYSHGTRKHTRIALSDNEITRQLNISNGMGLKQIISFLFNISLIIFKGASRIILLDETLSSISDDKAIVMSDIMSSLSKTNDFQIIIIDHNKNLWANEYVTVLELDNDKEKGLYIKNIIKNNNKNADVLESKTVLGENIDL